MERALPVATVKGTMLWFNEATDCGSILLDGGEQLAVDRDGFVNRDAPVGRCRGLPVRLIVGERDTARIAVQVAILPQEESGRARSRRSHFRTAP